MFLQSKKNLFLLVLFYLFLSSCDFSHKTNKPSTKNLKKKLAPDFSIPSKIYLKEKREKLQFFYDNYLGGDKFNGMFLVAKNGTVIFEKYNGFSNFNKEIKIGETTPLHLASISKVATSLAILRLVDKKLLLLDEDVRNFLPELPYEGISVRMLLNHRSGIPYYGYFSVNCWPKGKILRNRDLLLLLKKNKFPLNFKPDHKFAYSNTNFALLALIIEKITNKQFPKAMQDLIFDPLKMTQSFIMDNTKDQEAVSQSYNSKMSKQEFTYLDNIYGDKNMYSTVRDLLKMDVGTYSDNFLSASSKKEMYKGYSYENTGMRNYGLGMRIVEQKGKDSYFFHTGWWHGNRGCYATLRSDSVCIIALTNTNSQSVYAIDRLSNVFGNYACENMIDSSLVFSTKKSK
jgi:CubicO group peptidase (beta-lactamase class C family)